MYSQSPSRLPHFPDPLWFSVLDYLVSSCLSPDPLVLPGGRLGAGRALLSRLPPLGALCLGEGVLVVQLLLSYEVLRVESDKSKPECEHVLGLAHSFRAGALALGEVWRDSVYLVYPLALRAAQQYNLTVDTCEAVDTACRTKNIC